MNPLKHLWWNLWWNSQKGSIIDVWLGHKYVFVLLNWAYFLLHLFYLHSYQFKKQHFETSWSKEVNSIKIILQLLTLSNYFYWFDYILIYLLTVNLLLLLLLTSLNGWKPFTIFTKSYILDNWQGSDKVPR